MQPLIFDLLGLEDNLDSKYMGILNIKIQLVTKYPVVPCFRRDKMLITVAESYTAAIAHFCSRDRASVSDACTGGAGSV
ncbi:hypothetical protein NC652_023775 [Populus alba x Populus x berolinensis]|nr:hypothetical protein NC652_023775 [Populus alba x Populus x berolinensis]